MKMVANSIEMLRKYNKTIPVRVYYIMDEAKETFWRKNQIPTKFSRNKFFEFCDNLDVEIKECEAIRSDPPYYHLNRIHISDCEEKSALHIDGDTFIFGDVESIFEKYKDVDFAASVSRWMQQEHWDSKRYLGRPKLPPFNSGIMLWNNGWIKHWASSLSDICQLLLDKKHYASEWIYVFADPANREEVALTVFIAQSNLSYEPLDKEDVLLVEKQADLADISGHTIVHTYSDQWAEVYRSLNPKKPKKFKKRRIFSG